MTKKLLPLLTLTAVAALPATASARDSDRADAAMRKGIRDYARVVAKASASQISVDASRSIGKVGAQSTLSGSFRLTKDGRTVTYRLTSKARALRISPSGIEYRLSARAVNPVRGFESSTGSFTGFFQGAAAREG